MREITALLKTIAVFIGILAIMFGVLVGVFGFGPGRQLTGLARYIGIFILIQGILYWIPNRIVCKTSFGYKTYLFFSFASALLIGVALIKEALSASYHSSILFFWSFFAASITAPLSAILFKHESY